MNLRSLKFEHGLLTSTACVISRVLTVQLDQIKRMKKKKPINSGSRYTTVSQGQKT